MSRPEEYREASPEQIQTAVALLRLANNAEQYSLRVPKFRGEEFDMFWFTTREDRHTSIIAHYTWYVQGHGTSEPNYQLGLWKPDGTLVSPYITDTEKLVITPEDIVTAESIEAHIYTRSPRLPERIRPLESSWRRAPEPYRQPVIGSFWDRIPE